MHIHDSKPISSANNVKVTSNSEDYESNVPVIDDYDLPIAIRKDARNCTQHPQSHFVSYEKLLAVIKIFLSPQLYYYSKTVSEALGNKQWKEAMKVEMYALEKNKTWDLVDLPQGKNLVGCKQIFTMKCKADGLPEQQARIVAKRYTQTYGIDYLEIFSHIAKMNIVRILLSLIANRGQHLQQFDVKKAFLHSGLDEEIYMEVSPTSGELTTLLVYVDDIVVT